MDNRSVFANLTVISYLAVKHYSRRDFFPAFNTAISELSFINCRTHSNILVLHKDLWFLVLMH